MVVEVVVVVVVVVAVVVANNTNFFHHYVMDKTITLLVAAHLTCWTLDQFVQALFVVTY